MNLSHLSAVVDDTATVDRTLEYLQTHQSFKVIHLRLTPFFPSMATRSNLFNLFITLLAYNTCPDTQMISRTHSIRLPIMPKIHSVTLSIQVRRVCNLQALG